jgi:OmpA-OmpF porin, OOP family
MKANMKKVLVASAIALSGALAATQASAQAQDMGFYIGGAIGQAELKGACDGLPAGTSCDDKDSAWKVLGGYQFNRNLAVELGYANLGEASASLAGVTANVEVTAWDLVAVGSFPIVDKFSVYGKLGMFRSEAEGTSNVGASADDSETGFTFGLGLRYDFTRNLGVRLEWQRYTEVDEDTDVNLMSVGVIWRF